MSLTAEDTDRVFPQFSEEDELLLISLPYRVGLYVSHADTTGGFEAQEAELQSLANILREFAEDFCKSEFAQKILMESLRARNLWPAWSQSMDRVPEEARHITDMLETHFDERGLRAFKEVLVEIALSVAMAFREGAGDEKPRAAKPPRLSAIGYVLFRLMGKTSAGGDPLGHMNISRSERAALNRLCKAMHFEMN